MSSYPPFTDFLADYEEACNVVHTPAVRSFAQRRLMVLESRFELHRSLNGEKELADLKKVPHRDFYNVRKVDTHVHHSACMNQKHLLKFIRKKLKTCPEEPVIFRDDKVLTLAEVRDVCSRSCPARRCSSLLPLAPVVVVPCRCSNP